MSQAECRRVSCCNANGVEFSPFQYSIVNGETYLNDEMTFIISCPRGYDCTADDVTIVIPPGTIKFTPTLLDPNPPPSGSGDPWNPAAGTYTFDCGSETLTIRTTGTGFTNDQITQIIAFLAQCQANQDGNDVLLPTPIYTPSGQPGIRLWNTVQSCTVSCPDGETGDPVTVTIPANTNSVIIAADITPMEQYQAQQALNTAAYDQACAQAQSEISCNPAGVCPELKSSIVTGEPTLVGAAYGTTQQYVYALGGDGATVNITAYDIAENAQLDQDYAGFFSALSIVYASNNNRIFAVMQDGSGIFVRMIDSVTLGVLGDLNLTMGAVALRYIADLNLVLAHAQGGIALIDPDTATVTVSDNSGGADSIQADYCPTNATFYCPDNGTASIILRDSLLIPIGSVFLTDASLPVRCVYVPSLDVVLAAAQDSSGFLTLYVIQTSDNTVIDIIQSGLGLPCAMEYDSSLDLVYIVTSGPDTVVTWSPATGNILCTLNEVNSQISASNIAVDTDAMRFYVPTATDTLRKYGQP